MPLSQEGQDQRSNLGPNSTTEFETCDEFLCGDADDEIGQERKPSLYLRAPLCDSSA
jgi:hypothetical protein